MGKLGSSLSIGGDFAPRDIYGMEIIRFRWRNLTTNAAAAIGSVPPQDLTSLQTRKPEKFSLIMCCNADGTDKLPLWIVGTSHDATSFNRPDLIRPRLGFTWRENQWASVRKDVFRDWLLAFERHVGRDVLLILKYPSFRESVYYGLRKRRFNALRRVRLECNPTIAKRLPFAKTLFPLFEFKWKGTWIDHCFLMQSKGNDLHETCLKFQATAAAHWCVDVWEDFTSEGIEQAWNDLGCRTNFVREALLETSFRSSRKAKIERNSSTIPSRNSSIIARAATASLEDQANGNSTTLGPNRQAHPELDIVVMDQNASSSPRPENSEACETSQHLSAAMDAVDEAMEDIGDEEEVLEAILVVTAVCLIASDLTRDL